MGGISSNVEVFSSLDPKNSGNNIAACRDAAIKMASRRGVKAFSLFTSFGPGHQRNPNEFHIVAYRKGGLRGWKPVNWTINGKDRSTAIRCSPQTVWTYYQVPEKMSGRGKAFPVRR